METRLTKELLEELVPTCTSKRQVIAKAGLVPSGGNYCALNKGITKYGVDISHFTGHVGYREQVTGIRRTKEQFEAEILVENCSSFMTTYSLNKKLVHFGFKEEKCECCGIPDMYNGKPLSLHLHHKDGNRENNRLDNLELLCPNCHSQTDTYCGKNKKTHHKYA